MVVGADKALDLHELKRWLGELLWAVPQTDSAQPAAKVFRVKVSIIASSACCDPGNVAQGVVHCRQHIDQRVYLQASVIRSRPPHMLAR